MKVLLTGGAGFIGSHIAETLQREGWKVKIFSRFKRNAIQYMNTEGFEIIRGDVLSGGDLKYACRDVDAVIHLAAVTGIDAVAENPVSTMMTNFIGAINVFRVATDLKVKKVVTFSTGEVYGTMAYKTTENDDNTLPPVDDRRISYAASKLAADHLARSYYLQFGLPVTMIRPFNIYGERQVGHGAISRFVNWALKDEPLIIYGDGLQIRAWCHIDDLISLIPQVMKNHNIDGEALNIGNPSQTLTVLELARKIVEMTGSKSKFKFLPKRPVDVDIRVPNIAKVQKMLVYNPKVNLQEGLERTIKFYREHDVQVD